MDLLDALRSTGAVRDFRPDPIDDATLYRILDNARFAPSGGNRQGWRVIVVQDPAVRRALRDLYFAGHLEYMGQVMSGLVPFAPITDRDAEQRALAGASEHAERAKGSFADVIDQVPAMLVLLADLRALASMDRDLDRYTLVGGASIYPFAWSILLAAREEGIAGVITTMAIRREPEMKQVLDVPDEFAVAGLIVLGHPVHQPRKLKRAAVESFTTVDRFDGQPFTPSR